MIICWMAQWLLREYLAVGLWDAATHWHVGGSNLRPHNWEAGYFEIGYRVRASATGQGHITEAVKLLVDYAFTHLHATRVEIRCDERNEQSAAIDTIVSS